MGKSNISRTRIRKTTEKQKKIPVLTVGSIPELIIVLLYLLVEFVPRFDAVDSIGSQWLYLAILNPIVILYLIARKKLFPEEFLKSLPFLSLLAFLLISLISFFSAYNIIESLVTFSRLIISFFAFVNLMIIINSNRKVILPAMVVLSIILFIQSLQQIVLFEKLMNSNLSMDESILLLRGSGGNKNFVAAAILMKIPFIVYLIHRKELRIKIIAIAGLIASSFTLFSLNSRSSILGLFLEALIFILVHSFFYFRSRQKKFLLNAGILIFSILISFFTIQLIFKNYEKKKENGVFGNVVKRLQTIGYSDEGSSHRFMLWQGAIDFISKHPFLGGGYGNWKIHSIPYESGVANGIGIYKHVHNDFLEVTADTGVLGGFFYVSFFGLIIFFGLRFFLNDNHPLDDKYIVLGLLMAFSGSLTDSFFNFPMERPDLYIIMLFSAAGIIVFSLVTLDNAVNSIKLKYSFPLWIFLILSVGVIYISVQAYNSMVAQLKVYVEWAGNSRPANPPIRSEDVNPLFPSIPNLNERGMPISNIKAKYLVDEKKYDEALVLLNKDKNTNPYLHFSDFLRARIALARDKKDSAIFYAKQAYYNRPACQNWYFFLYDIAYDLHDTVELWKVFYKKTSVRAEPIDFVDHSQNMFKINGNFSERKKIIEMGLLKFPEDSSLNFEKYFISGVSLSVEKNNDGSIKAFINALKYKDDPLTCQNLGFEYLIMGRFKDAIPFLTRTINSAKFANGQTEYYRGVCFKNLMINDKACDDFRKASFLGYHVKTEFLQICK